MSIEEVLLILNALVYSDGINDKIYKRNIYDLINTGEILKQDDVIATKEEWNALIRTIKQNEAYFSKVKLVDIESKREAQKNVAFVNENVNADRKQEVYVVFKGTGSLEWHDNAKGALLMVPLTPQQQNALNYANRIAKDYSQYDFIEINNLI